jgi:NAD(P)-dependent dehydrogenase (short-subunit alcohol dehydrogenase family)
VRASEAAKLLRPGLLEGVWVLLVGAAGEQPSAASARAAIHAALGELGARVAECEATVAGELAAEADIQRAVAAAPAAEARTGMLIVDGAGMFLAAGAGRAGLRVCAEATWCVTRALADAAFIPGGRGGRIVYLAPAPGAGPHAPAARAALENLARTLSIEWARHGITAVTIGAGDASRASELASLAAYLGSEAGAYFSGCMLDLTGPRCGG